jgi:hypothetical protein
MVALSGSAIPRSTGNLSVPPRVPPRVPPNPRLSDALSAGDGSAGGGGERKKGTPPRRRSFVRTRTLVDSRHESRAVFSSE